MALEKAILTNTVSGDRVAVQFNPEEYTLDREINYAQATVPGLSAPLLQFVAGNLQTLEMELLLDAYEAHDGPAATEANGDVRELVRRVTSLMDVDASTHAPPVVLFTWGSLSFTCVLARTSQKFIMFRPDGVPVRARVQVTFNEYRNGDLEAKEVKRETADYSRLYVVSQDETASAIAARVYGNAQLWRPIALHNGLDEVRALAPGLRLLIPQLPYRDRETGELMA